MGSSLGLEGASVVSVEDDGDLSAGEDIWRGARDGGDDMVLGNPGQCCVAENWIRYGLIRTRVVLAD